MANTNVTETKALIRGALLYRFGKAVAYNEEVLDKAWDCYSNYIENEHLSTEEALVACVDEYNVAELDS